MKGQKVRITDGVFKGVIGEFVRIRHDRRVVVNIEGVMAIATTFIPPSLVEPVVVDCVISPDENVLPMIPPGKTVNEIVTSMDAGIAFAEKIGYLIYQLSSNHTVRRQPYNFKF